MNAHLVACPHTRKESRILLTQLTLGRIWHPDMVCGCPVVLFCQFGASLCKATMGISVQTYFQGQNSGIAMPESSRVCVGMCVRVCVPNIRMCTLEHPHTAPCMPRKSPQDPHTGSSEFLSRGLARPYLALTACHLYSFPFILPKLEKINEKAKCH